jgi:ABC-type multidrug transport system fused ATPase/permease subunit
MTIYKKILSLINQNQRKDLFVLIFLSLLMSLIEVVGIASVLPFLSIIMNPSIIETNLTLNKFYMYLKAFGVDDVQDFFFILGIIVFIIFVTSNFLKTVTGYLQIRFTQICEFHISKRLVNLYLIQHYSWFLNRHSADIAKTILSEVGQIVGRCVKPLVDIVVNIIALIFIVLLLIIVDVKVATSVGFVVLLTYFLIFSLVRSYLKKIGDARLKSNEIRYVTIHDAFNGIKEIKVLGLEKFFLNRFSEPARTFARAQTHSAAIATLPRYILETLAFGGVLLLILYSINQQGNFAHAIPIMSLYLLAGYRIMPSMQKIYHAFSLLNFSLPALDKLHKDLMVLKKNNLKENQNPMSLEKSMSLKNISYSYPNSKKTSLKNINLTIPAKTTVGFIGPTGSGKTSLIDLILGLLRPQKGFLEVDNQIINLDNTRSWQKLIGYVPQQIYLTDETIASNIAFGLDPSEINEASLINACKIANLHDFIKNDLPQQYNTIIGENGIRLSGGQRQRIGIARALYNNPEVLILDEATSALDNQTEEDVMSAINNLEKKITIILIAHRLNTVKNCSIIFKIENGKVIKQGTYNEIFDLK